MKTIHTTLSTGKLSVILLGMVLHASILSAQGVNPPGIPPRAGEEFQPAIGQGTNIVSAREIRWTGSFGLEGRAYVCLTKGSRHAIVASSTNQVCFLKGKLFAVEIGIQSFSLLTSRPIEATELTAETAIRALENVPRNSPRRKEIDLASLLKSEAERHLAQPLFLHSVQLRAEEGMLIVEFDSCTHLKGKVVLDDKLNVISMTLLDNRKHQEGEGVSPTNKP